MACFFAYTPCYKTFATLPPKNRRSNLRLYFAVDQVRYLETREEGTLPVLAKLVRPAPASSVSFLTGELLIEEGGKPVVIFQPLRNLRLAQAAAAAAAAAAAVVVVVVVVVVADLVVIVVVVVVVAVLVVVVLPAAVLPADDALLLAPVGVGYADAHPATPLVRRGDCSRGKRDISHRGTGCPPEVSRRARCQLLRSPRRCDLRHSNKE